MPRVSVVMPVYNGATYLEAAVRSVLDQTLRDLELIVVDDGSSDNSLAILERVAGGDSRMRVEPLPKNRGHCVASNRALELAQGELIVRHDQDDLLMPDWLDTAVGFLADHDEVGVLGGAYRILDGEEPGRLVVAPRRHTEIRASLVFKNVICHPGTVMRARLRDTDQLEYRDFAGPQDYDLWVRLLDVTRGANLPIQAVVYRRHALTMSAEFESEMPTDVERISDRQLAELLKTYVVDRDIARSIRRLWRAQLLDPGDLRHVDLLASVLDGLAGKAFVEPHELSAVRRAWAGRLLSRSVRTYHRVPWRLVRAEPGATAEWMLRDVPIAAFRRLRGMSVRTPDRCSARKETSHE